MYFFINPTTSELNLSSLGLGFLDTLINFQMGVLKFAKRTFLRAMAALWEVIITSCLAGYYIAEAVVLFLTPGYMRTQKSLKDKVVLVTGGAGGVGQELTLRLARLKARVIVWDINEKALDKVKDTCEKEGYKIYTYTVDITDRTNVYKNAELVKNEIGVVDVLINNAGIVCGNTFLDIPDNMIEKTFQVNVISHYWTTKAFLGDMLKKGRGHIVTMGSLTGLLGTYKCTDYSATKHATIGFHDSLLTELRTHGHDNIKMTIICPYFINTGMFEGCTPNMPMLEPKYVAKRLITAIRREEVFVTMPGWARYVLSIKNFLPGKLAFLIFCRLVRGPESMMGLRPYQETVENIAPQHIVDAVAA